MKKMNVIGLVLSVAPLPVFILFLVFGPASAVAYEHQTIHKFLLLVSLYLPYIVFSGIRSLLCREDPAFAFWLKTSFYLNGLLVIFIFLSPLIIISSPATELFLALKVRQLERQERWLYYDIQVSKELTNLQPRMTSNISQGDNRYSITGIVLSFLPLLALLITLPMIQYLFQQAPSGLVLIFPLILFYFPTIMIYMLYLNKRRLIYPRSSEIGQILDQFIGLQKFAGHPLNPLCPILLPILEIICYVKIRRLDQWWEN